MSELLPSLIERLKGELPKGVQEALPRVIGGSTAAAGIWRFFAPHTAATWNLANIWRSSWPGLSPEFFFFGEDIFGNQLLLRPQSENIWLWNHENGEVVDLLLDPVTLLDTVRQSGLGWIDFYSEQMLAIARTRLLDVPQDFHLHWTQPLILGGAVNVANTSIVESISHLRGHGSLWAQLRGLPVGTEVIIKPPQ